MNFSAASHHTTMKMKAKSFVKSDITHEIDLYSLRTGTGTFVVAYHLAICCKIQRNKDANPIKTQPAAMAVYV